MSTMRRTIRQLFPVALSTIYALVAQPKSIIGYIASFCVALIIFWLFDTPDKEVIDRSGINIDIPIEFDKTETGIDLQK